MKFAEIITIGDELLIGQVVDTNSAWMGQKLNEIGIKVKQISSVSDDKQHIVTALKEAASRADVILMTGGLGPTKDDITKKTLAEFFDSTMVLSEDSLAIIQEIFRSRGREMTELNRQQAMVPNKCNVLLNKNGTAPGMLFEHDGKIYISMPGVPNEMKGLMESAVLPILKERFNLPRVVHRTVLTQGIGESFLSDKIESWELALPPHIKLAYLPAAGMVRLRLSASGKDESTLQKEVETEVTKLSSIIHEYIFGFENDTLEELIGQLLREKKKTLCTAESCTGGYIAHKITSVTGSSDYYQGSIVAYANLLKTDLLNLDPETLKKHGAVSKETVQAMADSARKVLASDYAIATSGIAGPTGGSPEKPVGTVWIAISGESGTEAWKVQLGSNRLRVIMETSNHALNGLRKRLLEE